MDAPPAARAVQQGAGIFYFDLASPLCYLAAELISVALPQLRDWRAVSERRLHDGRHTWPRRQVERDGHRLGLLPLRWPPEPAGELREALLAATYAREVGRGIAFARAAFRQAFAGGQDLSDADRLLIAGAACELHPTALLKASSSRRTEALLEASTRAAIAAGVRSLPAVLAGGERHCGWQEVSALCTKLRDDGAQTQPALAGGSL
ncbi:MAG TPA: DsbA family protein [Solirubrobacteraceae bacterium]|nr:DsbA family protein [Solirubrobacteraceae bacterium]